MQVQGLRERAQELREQSQKWLRKYAPQEWLKPTVLSPIVDFTTIIKVETSSGIKKEGSGIILGRHILTAGHLFRQEPSCISCKINENGKDNQLALFLAFLDTEEDVALLSFSEKPLKSRQTIKVSQRRIKLREQIYLVSSQEKKIKVGIIQWVASKTSPQRGRFSFLLKDSKIIMGESGSPIFRTESNELVGILCGTSEVEHYHGACYDIEVDEGRIKDKIVF